MDGVITLLSSQIIKDQYGVEKEILTPREVFCKINSVTRAEFFNGGRNGLNPEFRFDVFALDYEGEQSLLFNGQRYAIYRTYANGSDTIELYVERKGGTNGQSNA